MTKQLAIAILFVNALSVLIASAVPINQDAHQLARAFPHSSLSGGNLGQAEKQMQSLMVALNRSGRNSRSSLQALLSKAMDFRKDIGPNQKAASCNSLLNAWETAQAYGAFDEKGGFIGKATRGKYEGQKLIFENIVSQETAPEFVGYFGNLRLVPEDSARKPGDPATLREQGYLVELRNIQEEYGTRKAMLDREKSKVGDLAIAKEDASARFRAEVLQAGDQFNQEPNLRLVGQRLSSPSKMNDHTYRVRFEVTNFSRHPTEIELECIILGYTENENKLYELKKIRQPLKLRRSEVQSLEVRTDNVASFGGALKKFDPKKSTKVIYRGYIIRGYFRDKLVAHAGSDGRLAPIASGENPVEIPKIK